MVNTVTVKMRDVFKLHGFLTEEDKREKLPQTSFILIFRGEIFIIDTGFAVNTPVEDYFAIGSGSKFALGSLHTTEHVGNLDPETRIKIALDAASFYDEGVAPPYEILSLEWDGFEHNSTYRFYDSDGTVKEDKLVNDFPKEKKNDSDSAN
jgi:hypothetical protein